MVSGSPIVSDLYYEENWDQKRSLNDFTKYCFILKKIWTKKPVSKKKNMDKRFPKISLNYFTKYDLDLYSQETPQI